VSSGRCSVPGAGADAEADLPAATAGGRFRDRGATGTVRPTGNLDPVSDTPLGDASDDEITDEITDDELTALALAADPDTVVEADATPIKRWGGDGSAHPLPEWYMPVPVGALRPLRGWRRGIGILVVASFVLINAYGLCSTYGVVGFG